MFEHFTEHARQVLSMEGMEARRMHHTYLGTEHLLLALIHECHGHGHRALEKLGVTHAQARQALSELVAEEPDTDVPDFFPQTPRAKHVMEMALDEARRLKSADVGTEHLLLALLGEADGAAVKVLGILGVKPESVRDEVLRMLDEERRGVQSDS